MADKTYEILAPAGGRATLSAALSGGADAVYFGLKEFNARLRADNFTLDELADLMAELHQYGRRGYLTLNTLLFDDELKHLAAIMPKIARSAVDALIVTDLGLISFLRHEYPELTLHASTQMTTTTATGCAYLENLGIKRAILARELTLAEIANIHKESPLELEAFVHGAQCISYSGQCQMSQFLCGRSANRGLCAQPCRAAYSFNQGGPEKKRPYLLSPHDLEALKLLPEMLKAGVSSFKIEGRLKSPAYVYMVTSTYVRALKAALGSAPPITDEDAEALKFVYNRAPGPGYLKGVNHAALVSGTISSFQGLTIGELLGIEPHALYVAAKAGAQNSRLYKLKAGDGLAIGCPGGAVNYDEWAQGGRLYNMESCHYKGIEALKLTIGPDRLNPAKFKTGLVVYKNYDNDLAKELEKALKRRPQIFSPYILAVSLIVDGLKAGLNWQLAGADGRPLADFKQDLSEAIDPNSAVSAEILAKYLGRLGETLFRLGPVTLSQGGRAVAALPLALPPSKLNNLRREASAYFAPFCRQIPQNQAAKEFSWPAMELIAPPPTSLSVLLRTGEQVKTLLAAPVVSKLDIIYLDLLGRELADLLPLIKAAGRHFGLALPYIELPGDTLFEEILSYRPPALLVRTLGEIQKLKDYPGLLIGDSSLNATNSPAAAHLLAAGLSRYTPGWELLDSGVALPGERSSRLEQLIYTHRPLMVTRHCLLAAGSGRENCQTCPNKEPNRAPFKLWPADKKPPMLVKTICGKYSVIYSPKAETFAKRPGPGFYRLEFLQESGAELLQVIDNYLKM